MSKRVGPWEAQEARRMTHNFSLLESRFTFGRRFARRDVTKCPLSTVKLSIFSTWCSEFYCGSA